MRKFTLLFLILILSSCRNNVSISQVDEFFLENFSVQTLDYEYLLIIPQNGCSSCIKKAYNFLIENNQDEKIKFIFTHYSSVKAIKVRMRLLELEELIENLAFIELDDALTAGFSQLYPTLIEIDQNRNGRLKLMNREDSSDWVQLQNSLSSL